MTVWNRFPGDADMRLSRIVFDMLWRSIGATRYQRWQIAGLPVSQCRRQRFLDCRNVDVSGDSQHGFVWQNQRFVVIDDVRQLNRFNVCQNAFCRIAPGSRILTRSKIMAKSLLRFVF